MLGFSSSEIHPDRLPAIEKRIRRVARQAIQTAIEQVADELVAEHTLTPELAQRLKEATWWESRVLYTTPGATFPNSDHIQKLTKGYS